MRQVGLLGALAAIVLAAVMSEGSNAHRPRIQKQVGTNHCIISPDSVSILRHGVKSEIAVQPPLDAPALETAIKQSVSFPMETVAVHFMATNPPIIIRAALDETFTEIFIDAAAIVARKHSSTEMLFGLANQHCGNLK